jgi:hypothetical protein
MNVLKRTERLEKIYALLGERERCDSEASVLQQLEEVFDVIEDAHSGVPKNPNAHLSRQTDGRMYAPHPTFKIPGDGISTYRHRMGHKTCIGKNGSFRILKIEADLSETVVFEKLGTDGRGYWEK